MYKDPKNFNKMKGAMFNSFLIESTKCLEPTETCTEELIDSHSIQDSRILEVLAEDNHVIHITFDKSCISKSKQDNPIMPYCKYDSISVHKASVFKGLCNKHDTEIFRPIDVEVLDMDNKEHVFLLSYRSVMKELSTKIKVAGMTQSNFFSKVDLGEISGAVPTIEGMYAVQLYASAYEMYEYKKLFDEKYLSKNFASLYIRYLILDGKPTFATSAVFTTMEMALKEEVDEKICVNIFPYQEKVFVLFSCLNENAVYLDKNVDEIFEATNYYQKYLISKLVLRNCENTVFAPCYFNQWPQSKKILSLNFFMTLGMGIIQITKMQTCIFFDKTLYK